jgi:hypothetical protein
MGTDETFLSPTGTMTTAALTKEAAIPVVPVLIPIFNTAITIVLMTARGLLLMHTLCGVLATPSTQGIITPQYEMHIVQYLKIWSLKKFRSFPLTHTPLLMTQGTKSIGRVELQNLTAPNPCNPRHTKML